MTEEFHTMVRQAQTALDSSCPGLAWGPVEEDHVVREIDAGTCLRVGACRAEGPLLRVSDEPEVISRLNDVLVRYGFPTQRPSGGSPWGEFVLTSTRGRDEARFEWRGRRGMRVWVDLVVS